MSTPVVLALVSGLLHAVWNSIAKTTGRERGATLAILSIAWLASAMLLPLVGGPLGGGLRGAAPWLVLAGLGEASYVFCLGQAYARGDLALTYASSRAAALVFVWPLSWLFFGAVPSPLALLASTFVALGIERSAKRAGASSTAAEGARWSVPWSLATGASVALYHSGYKGAAALGLDPVRTFVFALTLAVPLLWLAMPAGVRSDATALARVPRVYVGGVASAGSFLLAIAALAKSESGRVLGLRNASVGFTLLFAVLLGERLARRQWVGVAILGAGVLLFAFE